MQARVYTLNYLMYNGPEVHAKTNGEGGTTPNAYLPSRSKE